MREKNVAERCPGRELGSSFSSRAAVYFAPCCFCLLAMQCYVGTRTYSGTYAMFSNLRVEGDQSNHFFFHSGMRLTRLLFGAGSAWDFLGDRVEILDSNVAEFRKHQIDLFPLFTHPPVKIGEGAGDGEIQAAPHVHEAGARWAQSVLERHGMSLARAYINPPRWPYQAAHLTPYSIPFVTFHAEVRRVLARCHVDFDKCLGFFVRFKRRRADNSSQKGMEDVQVIDFARLSGSKTSNVEADASSLDELSWPHPARWMFAAGAFRSFDEDGPSYCRH